MIISTSQIAELVDMCMMSLDGLDEDSTIEELIEALNNNPNDLCCLKEEE